MSDPTPAAPRDIGLARWQRAGLVALAVAVVLFGLLVEMRSAFLKRHMTDFQVYLRAAWAVRTGHDLYTVQDDNHWHYHYPPLFAILLTPFADAPKGAEPLTLPVPFAVSVALWYAFSVLCLALAVHWLATALEETAAAAGRPVPPRGSRRWWTLRVLPVLACLAPVGGTLGRGQVNLLLLALLCGMTAAALRRQSGRAGLWLAGAICLKVIPAFLLIYPLWRRDGRWLAGAGIGLLLGLFVLPAAVLGPARTVACYREWTDVLARPALGTGHDDHSRDVELLGATATDSQSFEILLHNFQHFDRRTRPYYQTPAPEIRLAHWLIGGSLTALTLLAIGWRRAGVAPTVLGLGALFLIMVLLSPVCHLHYFCVAVPLVMGLLYQHWQRGVRGPWLGWGLAALLAANALANALPHVPGLEVLRDVGSATGGTLLLWLTATVVLVRARWASPAATAAPARGALGAAA